ncbi:MAG: acyl-CoA dehydrogenase family protein [Dongiaceae bacterium]
MSPEGGGPGPAGGPTLPAEVRAWKARVAPFAARLIPHEVAAELAGGELPEAVRAAHEAEAAALGLPAMDVPAAWGGLALSTQVQAGIWEELGRVTNALAWCFAEPQRWMFQACSPAQIERWILPMMRGELHDCYAITEAESGSDVAIATTAVPEGDGYRIDGEKWYVTSANRADFFILQARIAGGPNEGGPNDGAHALFFVDIDAPGVRLVRTPQFSHSFAAHHPIYRFEGVHVAAGRRIGAEGEGMGFVQEWFRRERIMIAARCCGAAARLIEEAHAFAAGRQVAGQRLASHQAIQFMLADSVVELAGARLLTYQAAAAEDAGEDRKVVHARASMAKLQASEMANRVADRAVQIFGGRGYMRENVAERFYRELRVDRIWEGTSEVQRLIIANGLAKRGLASLLG